MCGKFLHISLICWRSSRTVVYLTPQLQHSRNKVKITQLKCVRLDYAHQHLCCSFEYVMSVSKLLLDMVTVRSYLNMINKHIAISEKNKCKSSFCKIGWEIGVHLNYAICFCWRYLHVKPYRIQQIASKYFLRKTKSQEQHVKHTNTFWN